MFTNPIHTGMMSNQRDYDLDGTSEGGSRYKDRSATIDKPRTLTIAHQHTGVNTPNQLRRSKYRFDWVVENEQGVQGTLSATLQLTVPEKAASATDVANILEHMSGMLSDTELGGKLEKIKDGSI